MAANLSSENPLGPYERQHRELAEHLARIGFLWPGSMSRRYLTCGNPRCACRTKPEARHGPYFYWSTKKAGKTVSRKLSAEEAEVISQWIENRKELTRLIDRMMAVSQQALPLVLEQKQLKT